MSLIYIKRHSHNANRWIYEGYFKAWKNLGFFPIYFEKYEEIKEKDYLLMTTDWTIKTDYDLEKIAQSKKSFVFVQPTKFVEPWSQHPNYMCNMSQQHRQILNNLSNVYKWTFLDFEKTEFYSYWMGLNKHPLAFDNISYSNFEKNNSYSYDVCYIGGRANNGYDEKYKIMINTFKPFMRTNLRCGFFVEKNLSHEQEKNILFNSKICLNIHDSYQEVLGLDTNERTFKSLGINGSLLCTNNGQLNRMFPHIKTANSYVELIEIANELLNYSNFEQSKEENRRYILENHTYECRVKEMLGRI